MARTTAPAGLFFLTMILSHCTKEENRPVEDIGIVINEIDANGNDWIEFYNRTSSAVNLAGFKVYDDAAEKFTIASGTIPANGYFILNCDGSGLDGNASFRLSSAGETIALEDGGGKLVDRITFPAIDNGSSFARFPDGGDAWRITGVPTKGAGNGSSEAATISDFERTPVVPARNQSINVSAKVTDLVGITSVKLFYRKDADPFAPLTMVLSGGLYTATIPAMTTLGKVEYYIEVVNSRGVTTRDPKDAPAKTESYLLNEDPLPNLKVNEILALNSSCCPDNSGGAAEFDDWFEIYNAGTSSVDLNGFYLSDNNGNPFKFRIEGSTVIPAGGFLLIWADEQGSQGKLHANFQLSGSGEDAGIYYIDGRTIDFRTYGAPQTENVSIGRATDGGDTWRSFSTPTPGRSNQ
jgi:hypothetical protein